MGTGGPGNIAHIDNLYVKTFDVKDNVNIKLGDFVKFDIDGVRPLLDSDFTGPDAFLELAINNISQAGEDANNLTTTDPLLRKNQISCLTIGSDWIVIMRAGVEPSQPVGILRVGTAELFEVSHVNIALSKVTILETIGLYKHKEFSTVGKVSAQNDNGIISTGYV